MPPAPTPRASLERRLPILIGGLLLVVVILMAAMSYGVVKNSATAIGSERLRGVAGQLGTMLGTSAANSERAMRAGAADTQVVRFLHHPSTRHRPGLMPVFRRWRPSSNQTLSVELWDTQGAMVATSDTLRNTPYGDASAEMREAIANSRNYAVGRLRFERDTAAYPIVAAVHGPGGHLGYYVAWSRIGGAPQQARNPLLELIGEGSNLLIGNDSNWTDLGGRTSAPPTSLIVSNDVRHYSRNGARVFGRSIRVPNAPWSAVLEFPENVVLGSVGAYVRNASIIGVVIIMFGLILAWRVSKSITQPIARLAESASRISQGDFTRPADASRPDELGALGAAFNTMADRVRNTQTVLEERVRERTRKLEERNEELEAFAYTVAHDLRSPIRAMHGFSDALLQDFGDVLGYRGRDYAKRVVDAARRMDALVRDLLEYSQIARGEIDLGPVELTGVVKNAIASEDAEIRSTGAQVTVDSPLPVVLAHDATLSQAVMNLVGNALKFVPPGKKPMVHISAERREKWTRLWVTDNGLGIAPEQHDMIFRVFERLHRREDYPGTGIGLAIVRKGVERMGGRSGVESAPGSGSRFWIELQTAGNGA